MKKHYRQVCDYCHMTIEREMSPLKEMLLKLAVGPITFMCSECTEKDFPGIDEKIEAMLKDGRTSFTIVNDQQPFREQDFDLPRDDFDLPQDWKPGT